MQPSAPAPVSYTVQTGDTANSIAAAHGYTNYKTAGISGFKSGNPDIITPGEVLTVSGVPATNNLINTSTQSRTQTAQASSDLSAALAKLGGQSTQANPTPDANGGGSSTTTDPNVDPTTGLSNSDPIISGLNTLSANSDAATKSLIASTIASYQTQRNAVTQQGENYKRGLQQLGLETGAAEATPDLLSGHIIQAGNDELTKINDLQAKESKALIDAQNAKATGDFKNLQAKMAYVKQVQTDKANAIKNMYDSITTAKTASADEASAVYSTMQTLNPDDQVTYLTAVAKKYGLPLDQLTAQVAAIKTAQDKAALATKNTESIIAKRNSPAASKTGVTATQKAQGMQILKTGIDQNGNKVGNPQGGDGYVDPSVYISLFNDFPGTASQFLTLYPRSNVNPSSYSILPAALQPKTKSSTTPTNPFGQ